jgi:hypothetical protein
MGSRIEDSFYAPHDVLTGIQDFLADNDDLFSKQSVNEVAVVYSIESNRGLVARADAADNISNARDESVEVPYRVTTAAFAQAAVPFDVVLFPDGVTAEDRVTPATLRRYGSVVLPSCTHLTAGQAEALLDFLDGGGQVVVTGDLGTNLPEELRGKLTAHERLSTGQHADVDSLLPLGRQVQGEGLDGVAVNVAQFDDGAAAVHLVNYDYDRDADRVVPRTGVRLDVALPGTPTHATLVTPEGAATELTLSGFEGRCSVELTELPLYSIVVFGPGRQGESS